MKYKYQITEKEAIKVFGELFDLDSFDIYPDFNDEGEPIESSDLYISLKRGYQDKDIVEVRPTSFTHFQIILDYISYDKSSWDFQPKVLVIFPNGSTIQLNRRGNEGHRGQLEIGDYLILNGSIKAALDNNGFMGMSRSQQDLYDQITGLIKTVQAQQNTIAELRKQLEGFVPKVPTYTDDLPF